MNARMAKTAGMMTSYQNNQSIKSSTKNDSSFIWPQSCNLVISNSNSTLLNRREKKRETKTCNEDTRNSSPLVKNRNGIFKVPAKQEKRADPQKQTQPIITSIGASLYRQRGNNI